MTRFSVEFANRVMLLGRDQAVVQGWAVWLLVSHAGVATCKSDNITSAFGPVRCNGKRLQYQNSTRGPEC